MNGGEPMNQRKIEFVSKHFPEGNDPKKFKPGSEIREK
jgi:hypothetical protein